MTNGHGLHKSMKVSTIELVDFYWPIRHYAASGTNNKYITERLTIGEVISDKVAALHLRQLPHKMTNNPLSVPVDGRRRSRHAPGVCSPAHCHKITARRAITTLHHQKQLRQGSQCLPSSTIIDRFGLRTVIAGEQTPLADSQNRYRWK